MKKDQAPDSEHSEKQSIGINVESETEAGNSRIVPFEPKDQIAAASLESIVCTQELHNRPSRLPEYERENRALAALASALADSPATILQTLADNVLELLHADSAGLSLLTKDGKKFYWAAVAGAWGQHVGAHAPRSFGPCGDVLDHDVPMLFAHWEQRYPYLSWAMPLADEGLLVPFYVNGKAVGTIWAVAHESRRKFDAEDLRLLESTSRFASAAYQVVQSIESLKLEIAAREEAEAEVLAKAQLAGEKQLLEMVASGCTLTDVLTELCKFVEETTADCKCGVYLIDWSGPRLRIGAVPSLPATFNDPIEGLTLTASVGPCGVAALTKTQIIATDLESDPLWQECAIRPLALTHGLRAQWSTPIYAQDGGVLGTFVIYQHEPAKPTQMQLELIEQVTHIASIAINRASSEAELQKAFEEIKRLKDRLQGENLALKEEIDQTSMFEEVVGTSASLRDVLARVSKVAPADSTVLLTGETGTGKELIARAIHKRSERSSCPFVSVNCAAIPPSLIASELFGHEKGAFTGASGRRLGRFELAEEGTIFLDEVGELPAETQVALLRVLQEREFERVGGNQPIRANARIIAATNRDLEDAITTGSFRSDLFYRLNVFPIEIPPLSERKEDIPLLVEYFIGRFARKAGKNIRGISRKTLDLLMAYPWPGNIRELQNIVERSVIVCETEFLSVDESWLSRPRRVTPKGNLTLSQLAVREREIIEAALRESGGRVAGPLGAAARLGIPGSTLESKIKTLKISKSHFKS